METANLYLAGLILTAIAWVSRELWHRRSAKRQAAHDASKILNERKTLLEELISKTQDKLRKNELKTQLDEVNAALLGLQTKRLRQTLKDADLPPEETLIANGRKRLQPQQVNSIKKVIAELKTLPPFASVQDLLTLGNAYYYAEQFKDAKDTYDKILNLNPDEPATLTNRGVTYDELGRYDKALADYNRSLELEPDDSVALTNRGVTYRHLKRYDEALADYNRALELRPDYPRTLHNRGVTYYEMERYDEALADYNRSLELRPDYSSTLHNRGITYTKLERYDEALADFNRALELNPDYESPVYNLACLFSLWGKRKDALAYLEKAISKNKKFREMAKTDKYFDNIRDDPHFKKLIEPD